MINYTKTPYTRGLRCIDKKFGKPGVRELIVLFGLMSSGKTEMSFFMARENAKIGNKVLYISLELPEYDMKLRLARKKAGINKFDFQEQNFSEEQKLVMESEWELLQKEPNIKIVSPEEKTLGSMMTEIMKGYDEGYKMIFIDNLDKIPMPGADENSRYQKITTTLQDYKNNNDACIILIHHAKKPDNKGFNYKRGGLSGMRGSQKIMDNATQVLEIYRDLDPDEDDKKTKARVELAQIKDTFEGANGVVEIYFLRGKYVDEATYDQMIKEERQRMIEGQNGVPF